MGKLRPPTQNRVKLFVSSFREWKLFTPLSFNMDKTSSYCIKTTPKLFVPPPPPSAWLKHFVGVKLHFSHKIWNVSHRNYSCAFTTSYHVSHYPVYTEITKITSSIDAKTEPHEGRNMVSVDLSALAQTGCVVTKGTRLCLESVGLSVLLKMNAGQFTLDIFELLFFSTISTF